MFPSKAKLFSICLEAPSIELQERLAIVAELGNKMNRRSRSILLLNQSIEGREEAILPT